MTAYLLAFATLIRTPGEFRVGLEPVQLPSMARAGRLRVLRTGMRTEGPRSNRAEQGAFAELLEPSEPSARSELTEPSELSPRTRTNPNHPYNPNNPNHLDQPNPAILSILTDPALKGASIAVCVQNAKGQTLFAHNSDQRLMPASNQKLLTCLFAYHTLGPDRRSLTSFWKDGSTLTIQAGGEPGTTLEELQKINQSLGGPFSVVRLKQAYRPGAHPDWSIGDLPNAYAAPIYAFTVNRGIFDLRSTPEGTLAPLPEALGIKITQNPQNPSPTWKYDLAGDTITFQGQPPREDKSLERFALRRPDLAAARFFGPLVVPATTVPNRPPDERLAGPSFQENATLCLQASNNLFAEHILIISAGEAEPLNPWPKATRALQDFLVNTVKWPEPPPRCADGSGLSRLNLVTTQGICRTLQWAKDQTWYKNFKEALARPGVGTLRARLKGVEFYGKTGTLTGASALSGYLKTKDEKELVVSVIINNANLSTPAQQAIIDKIITTLENKAPDEAALPLLPIALRRPKVLPHSGIAAVTRDRIR